VMGTPNYMSPEQALGRIEEIDERTDQWALACIAWECLCGRGPFTGENVSSILYQVVHEPPPDLMSTAAGLAPEVDEVLRCALAKAKKDRFASVDAFSSALESAMASPAQAPSKEASVPRTELLLDTGLGGLPGTKKSTTFTRTAGESGESTEDRRGSRRIWAVAGGAAIALSLAAALLLHPGSAARPQPIVPVPDASPPSPKAFVPLPDAGPDIGPEPRQMKDDPSAAVEDKPVATVKPQQGPRPKPQQILRPTPQPVPIVAPPPPAPAPPVQPKRRLIKDL
jgi:serine/threonine protein kinase